MSPELARVPESPPVRAFSAGGQLEESGDTPGDGSDVAGAP